MMTQVISSHTCPVNWLVVFALSRRYLKAKATMAMVMPASNSRLAPPISSSARSTSRAISDGDEMGISQNLLQ